jgi:hypothetical protein
MMWRFIPKVYEMNASIEFMDSSSTTSTQVGERDRVGLNNSKRLVA